MNKFFLAPWWKRWAGNKCWRNKRQRFFPRPRSTFAWTTKCNWR